MGISSCWTGNFANMNDMNDNHFNAPGNEFCTCTRWRNPTVASQAGPSGSRANQRRWQVQHLSEILSQAMLQTQLPVDSFSEITCSTQFACTTAVWSFLRTYYKALGENLAMSKCNFNSSELNNLIWHCICKSHKTRKSFLLWIININFLLQIKTFFNEDLFSQTVN